MSTIKKNVVYRGVNQTKVQYDNRNSRTCNMDSLA